MAILFCVENVEETKIFLFVGDKKSGKSNLILKFLDIQVASQDNIKPTVALDFKYATKKKDEVKTHVHTYELGGGRALSNLLQASLTHQSLSKIASICIVLDLSKPGNTIDSLNFWISAVKEHLN